MPGPQPAQKTMTNRPQSIDTLIERVRKDFLDAHVPTGLQRLMRMTSVHSSLMISDADAFVDARPNACALDNEDNKNEEEQATIEMMMNMRTKMRETNCLRR